MKCYASGLIVVSIALGCALPARAISEERTDSRQIGEMDPAATPARARGGFAIAHIFEIHGWSVSCAPRPRDQVHSCTMAKLITEVGAFRLILSSDTASLLIPNCRRAGPGTTLEVSREQAHSSLVNELSQAMRRAVHRCHEPSLDQLDGASETISLLARATD